MFTHSLLMPKWSILESKANTELTSITSSKQSLSQVLLGILHAGYLTMQTPRKKEAKEHNSVKHSRGSFSSDR